MTPAPTRADLDRLIAQLENWDADGESGRLLLEAAVMLRALSPSVALEPPPEPGTWQCRKCGYNRTVGPTWACPTIGICEPAIAPLAEPRSKPTVAELEEILSRPNTKIQMKPDGSIEGYDPPAEPAIAPDALPPRYDLIELATRLESCARRSSLLSSEETAMRDAATMLRAVAAVSTQNAAMRAATGPTNAEGALAALLKVRVALGLHRDSNDNLLDVIASLRDLAGRSTRRLAELAEPGSIGAFAARDAAIDRAEKAERENAALQERLTAAERAAIAMLAALDSLVGQPVEYRTAMEIANARDLLLPIAREPNAALASAATKQNGDSNAPPIVGTK